MSNYTLRLNFYQGAQLVNYNFNDFTLHYTLSNGYIWDYHVLINTQKLLHLYTLHRNDSTVERVTRCLGKLQNTTATTLDQHPWFRCTTLPATTHPQATTNHNAGQPHQKLQQDTGLRSGNPELHEGAQHGSSTTRSSPVPTGLLAHETTCWTTTSGATYPVVVVSLTSRSMEVVEVT